MRLLGRQELRALLEAPEDISVSMYLPTTRTGDVEQGVIRLKNLLREAEERLLVKGLRQPEAAGLLDRARTLVEDTLFWHHQADGLAIFLSERTFTYYRLPYQPGEMVEVADRFYVSPLLPLFAADGVFYVLGISQNSARLVQCSRDGAREVTPDGMPGSMADVLQYDEVSRNIQFRSGPSQGSGRGTAMYHGHGEGKDVAKDNIVRYLREVDHGIRETLKDEQAPLVLAGVGYIRALYAEVNTHAQLVSEGLDGNPDALEPGELQSRAWPIVEKYFSRERQVALARFGEGSARGLTAHIIGDVLAAAGDGRIGALFVAPGSHIWGQYSWQDRDAEIHGEYEPGDEDLVEAAVGRALLTGASVYVLAPADVPGGEPVAALLRY
ncbi:MAG: hypothetical protein JXA58_04110 [Dehalococcoidia bacterium]|nr:hypothetical protein [Dehalococcoidia bacterium]